MSDTERQINEDEDLFYFESDHVALRGNKDYSDLLKTIKILEAQRTSTIQSVDKLIEVQNEALRDPFAFVQKIKNEEDLNIPLREEIVELPGINWNKYEAKIPDEFLKQLDVDNTQTAEKKVLKEGRKPKTNSHIETFNKPWTSDEQKKLEELLIKFPPEAIEMRRYKKIANALGNRTVKQVTSRIQKYFMKLYNAGLPVPGRIPKTVIRKKAFNHKHQKNNFYLYKPSTFFPDMDVPVVMTDDEDDIPVAGPPENALDANSEISNSSCKPLKEDDEIQLKIQLLDQVKRDKLWQQNTSILFKHEGFKCDICNEEPIQGSRWHCYDCIKDSIDFCTDCMISQLLSQNYHPLSHNIVPLKNNRSVENATPSTSGYGIKLEPTSSCSSSDNEEDESSTSKNNDDSKIDDSIFYDPNYVLDIFSKNQGAYNYLDPNFIPEYNNRK